ncbi:MULTISPECIES: hypothetical protein [unclassified Helicobacter]|uniref:hypothetical protein n=1 Tax=unclassified Helicobacter TaxID=2593540 RepID=UPI000CF061EE|nr:MULTISPECIES: hypothetical protein [unclassified Helicobacter]
MNKIFVIILLCVLAFSKPIEWSFEQEFSLQKDELMLAKVSILDSTKELAMRWTLFKKEGIVVLLKYDGFNHQFILYPDYQRNQFVLKLEDFGSLKDSKLVLVFKYFEDKKAHFWIGIQGDASFLMEQ